MKMNPKLPIYLIALIATVSILVTSCKKESDESSVIKDGDGNIYTSLTINTQTWLLENLKTTKYNDGKSIPLETNDTEWKNLTAPGYCWYDNDINYKDTYGALYNWHAVNTDKLCPKGWHVPTNAEWTTLITSLGGEDLAGGKMKETGTTHWRAINEGADNESGFTALPAGERDIDLGFRFIREVAFFWSSTESSATDGLDRYVHYYNTTVFTSNRPKNYGLSVRCIRD